MVSLGRAAGVAVSLVALTVLGLVNATPRLRATASPVLSAARFQQVGVAPEVASKDQFRALRVAMAMPHADCVRKIALGNEDRQKVYNFFWAHSYASWYEDKSMPFDFWPKVVCDWLAALKTWSGSATPSSKSVFIAGGGPSGLAAALQLLRTHKFSKAHPLVVVNDRDTRDMLHVVSLTDNVLTRTEKEAELHGETTLHGMKELFEGLGVDKLFPGIIVEDRPIMATWAFVTNFLLACVRVLKHEGVTVRRHVQVASDNGALDTTAVTVDASNFLAFAAALKPADVKNEKVILKLLTDGNTVTASVSRGNDGLMYFKPDRVFFAFGGAGTARSSIVHWASSKGLLTADGNTYSLRPAFLAKTSKPTENYDGAVGQLFFAVVMKAGKDSKACQQLTKEYAGRHKASIWDTLVALPAKGHLFSKTSYSGYDGESLCHLEIPLNEPNCKNVADVKAKDTFCKTVIALDSSANVKRPGMAKMILSAEGELTLPGKNDMAMSLLMALAPEAKSAYKWLEAKIGDVVQLKLWRTKFEAIVSPPRLTSSKFMSIKCGYSLSGGAQGMFFLGDACRDAHPDLGMGVNDAAQQAYWMAESLDDIAAAAKKLNWWEAIVQTRILHKAKGGRMAWYDKASAQPVLNEMCELCKSPAKPSCEKPGTVKFDDVTSRGLCDLEKVAYK